MLALPEGTRFEECDEEVVVEFLEAIGRSKRSVAFRLLILLLLLLVGS